jgi:hypothetical protein
MTKFKRNAKQARDARRRRSAAKRKRHHEANYVIVPKHQMRSAAPAMLVDPAKVVVTQLTNDVKSAATFTSRSGAFRRIKKHKELAKRFWYRRVA